MTFFSDFAFILPKDFKYVKKNSYGALHIGSDEHLLFMAE